MATEALIFKGMGRGARRELAVSIPRDMKLDELLVTLRARLQESQGFFEGSPVVLEGRPLTPEERRLVGELMAEFGMQLQDPEGEPLGVGAGDASPGGGANRQTSGRPSAFDWTVRSSSGGDGGGIPIPSDDNTLLVRRTLRSGQRLYYPGNVVILGDVNPGAVVTCQGDIVVMGRLRGVAHAGAGGNEGARVVALRLQPTQLRIAGYISRAPDDAEEGPAWPEVAMISDGVIEIHAFTP